MKNEMGNLIYEASHHNIAGEKNKVNIFSITNSKDISNCSRLASFT